MHVGATGNGYLTNFHLNLEFSTGSQVLNRIYTKRNFMKTKMILAVTLLLGLAINSASAQIIRGKANNQRARISSGVRSGELTRPEAHRLHREKRHIRRDTYRARRNDGRIDARERKDIRQKQRKHSRRIYMAKHNRRQRA